MNTHIDFVKLADALEGAGTLLLVGRADALKADAVKATLPADLQPLWETMVDAASPGDAGGAQMTRRFEAPNAVGALVVPENASRHNTPVRPDAIAKLVAAHAPSEGPVSVVLVVEKSEHAFAAGVAAAKAFPSYSRKTSSTPRDALAVRVAALPMDGYTVDLPRLRAAAEATRLAARLVDMPTSELNVSTFAEVARTWAAKLNVEINVIEGEAVAHAGLGGLWGVGKAAMDLPALVIMSYEPEDADENTPTWAWVGKGITYDTGGLSIKPKSGMVGMKRDMGGAAAVLGAFVAAAELGVTQRVHAVLCLAENAVGPKAFRPDDVLTMYSGRTVEVNNTDAEGRLVLADGVAWAGRHLKPDVMVDMATLTGAQLVATGRRHAAVMCNDEDLEQKAIAAGKRCGELVFPVPYCPEFFRPEFASKVADMKNSVKDRMNAQTSCAGQFIAEHLGDYEGPWLHVDIAGPADANDRATGYGVALLLELLEEV